MLDSDAIPFLTQDTSARPSLLRESLTTAELRLVSEVEELLRNHGPHGMDFAARWIVDLTHDKLQLQETVHALMTALHHVTRTNQR